MRRMMMVLVAAALPAGCVPGSGPATIEPGAGAPPELGSSFNVHVENDTVRMELHVTNVTSGRLVLEFTTSQRYDFAVDRKDGASVFRWSAARSFAQALGREELAPGESRRYTASWPAPDRSGEYVATAWLVSSNYPVELRTLFRVPDE